MILFWKRDRQTDSSSEHFLIQLSTVRRHFPLMKGDMWDMRGEPHHLVMDQVQSFMTKEGVKPHSTNILLLYLTSDVADHQDIEEIMKHLKITTLLLIRNLGRSEGQFGVPRSAKTVGIMGDIGPVDGPSDLLSNDQPILVEGHRKEEGTDEVSDERAANENIKAEADIKAMEKLQKDWPEIPDQLLFDLGALIHSVKEKMKKEGADSALFVEARQVSSELAQALSMKELGLGMEKALESMKRIDQVFENAQGIGLVISDMKAKGFIETEAQEKKFRERPDLLKQEMTKTSYLTFVALAIAGNYIERPSEN